MSVFSEANKDAMSVAPEAAATGPLVGFFEAWSASVDEQMRTSSQYGIEYFMQELDWQQTKAMMDAGVADPPQLILGLEGRGPGEGAISVGQMLRDDSGYYEDFIPERSSPYLDVARRYAGEEISPEFEERLQAYDARVLKLREDRPDLALMTSREMFDNVRNAAQAAEAKVDTDRRTWGGAFGGFFGGALASMHPGTDPLNFYTLGVGGGGKTAMQRILMQFGGQGVIETVNQATGVQEEREILGLSHGLADAAQRVAGTALGGAALQGVGELAGYGLKRWFTGSAHDPAPPIDIALKEPSAAPPTRPASPEALREEARTARLEQDGRAYVDMLADRSPLSGIRQASPRIVADMADMTRQLEDWSVTSPAAVHPRTASAAFVAEPGRPTLDVKAAMDNNRVYQAAKAADPEVFRQYESLVERKNTYKRWVDELAQGRDKDIQATLDGIDTKMHSLEAKLRTTHGKNEKAKIRQQIDEVRADRDRVLKLSERKETPDIAQVRRDMMRTDEKMRDLAPMIGRAYARARGKWGETEPELDAVWKAYREGKATPDVPKSPLPDYDTALMQLQDRAPILRQQYPGEPKKTSAEAAQAIVAENAKVMDDALEAFRAEARQLVSATDTGKLRIEGQDYEFDLDADRMFVPHEDGTGGREMTLREILEEQKRVEDELEAVTICSVRKTS